MPKIAGLASSDKRVTSAGGNLFATGPDEFIVVGKDFSFIFTPVKIDAQKAKIEIVNMDGDSFVNGKCITIKVEW